MGCAAVLLGRSPFETTWKVVFAASTVFLRRASWFSRQLMADSSKTVTDQKTGSSRLELPTRKRGSSVTVKPKAANPEKVADAAEVAVP